MEHCVDRHWRSYGAETWELACLDPACGSGHFLVEYVNHVAPAVRRPGRLPLLSRNGSATSPSIASSASTRTARR